MIYTRQFPLGRWRSQTMFSNFQKIRRNLCIHQSSGQLRTDSCLPRLGYPFQKSTRWGIRHCFVLLHALLCGTDCSLSTRGRSLRSAVGSTWMEISTLTAWCTDSCAGRKLTLSPVWPNPLRKQPSVSDTTGVAVTQTQTKRKEISSCTEYWVEAMAELCAHQLFGVL